MKKLYTNKKKRCNIPDLMIGNIPDLVNGGVSDLILKKYMFVILMIRVICLWKPFLEIINYGAKSGGKPKGLSILKTETHPNQDEHVLISLQRE